MAWVATTSFETTDGSTSPVDGNNISATGDGTGWSATWSVTAGATKTWKYDSGITNIPNGSWVAECDCTGVNEEPVMVRTLTTAVTSGTVIFYWRFNKTNRDTHIMQLKSGATVAVTIDAFNIAAGNRDFRYTNSGGTDTVIASAIFAADTWYKITLEFDCATDTFSAYVDDVLKGSGLTFRNAVTDIDTIRFANAASSTAGSSAGSIHYVDYILPISATSIKSINGLVYASVKNVNSLAVASIKNFNGLA